MKRVMKVTATTNWMGLVKGTTFTIVKSFFYNGEGWYRLKTAEGTIVEYPDVFFSEAEAS